MINILTMQGHPGARGAAAGAVGHVADPRLGRHLRGGAVLVLPRGSLHPAIHVRHRHEPRAVHCRLLYAHHRHCPLQI